MDSSRTIHKKSEEKSGNMSSSLREGFLKIMKGYLNAKQKNLQDIN